MMFCNKSQAGSVSPLRTDKANGDRVKLKGMNGSKRLKIYLLMKSASFKRDSWPIVTDAVGNIIWIPGLKNHFEELDVTNNDRIVLQYRQHESVGASKE
ncbi:TilS substrate C-terminal domain-containing protein [Bacillus licheniformis]|nr:TilS substrate C-terminal domain-containing protein [Bacillus licheniformis]